MARRAARGLSTPKAKYWVDPDAGSHADAVQVECDSTGVTPVEAKQDIPRRNYVTNPNSADGDDIFSELTAGYRIQYVFSETQMAALAKMSSRIEQKFVLECQGVLAWRSTSGSLTTAALRFFGPGRS